MHLHSKVLLQLYLTFAGSPLKPAGLLLSLFVWSSRDPQHLNISALFLRLQTGQSVNLCTFSTVILMAFLHKTGIYFVSNCPC